MTPDDAPIERPDGQDDPPDLLLLLQAVRAHLVDLEDALDPDTDAHRRNAPILRALRRYLEAHRP